MLLEKACSDNQLNHCCIPYIAEDKAWHLKYERVAGCFSVWSSLRCCILKVIKWQNSNNTSTINKTNTNSPLQHWHCVSYYCMGAQSLYNEAIWTHSESHCTHMLIIISVTAVLLFVVVIWQNAANSSPAGDGTATSSRFKLDILKSKARTSLTSSLENIFARVGLNKEDFFFFKHLSFPAPMLYLYLISYSYFIFSLLSFSVYPCLRILFLHPWQNIATVLCTFIFSLYSLCIGCCFCVTVIQGIWIDPYLPSRQQNNSLV